MVEAQGVVGIEPLQAEAGAAVGADILHADVAGRLRLVVHVGHGRPTLAVARQAVGVLRLGARRVRVVGQRAAPDLLQFTVQPVHTGAVGAVVESEQIVVGRGHNLQIQAL